MQYKLQKHKRQDNLVLFEAKQQFKEDLHTFLIEYHHSMRHSYLLAEQGEQNTSQLAQRNDVRSRDRSASKERDACVSAAIEASLSGCTIF